MSFRSCFEGKTAVNFREFMRRVSPEISSGYPSMVESMRDDPTQGQDAIVEYLNSADLTFVGSSLTRDVFTGEVTGVRAGVRSDDTYYWSNDLAYYVDRYNVQLPQEFMSHILSIVES